MPNRGQELIDWIQSTFPRKRGPMRDIFRGYYHPTEIETKAVWEGGIITLDANVLLSLYRVLPSTSSLYLKALVSRKEQMWLSYQVGEEFHRHVHTVRNSQTKDHDARIKEVQVAINTISNTASQSRLEKTDAQQQAVAALEAFRDELKSQQAKIGSENAPKSLDLLLGRIANLFEDRVGPAPTIEELTELHTSGAKRFENKQPPGYEDKKKDGERAYGDYILWQQIMDHSKASERDIILVTDDDKSDWWLKGGSDGKLSLAPRPELIQEFRAETGHEILIYNSQEFYSLLTSQQAHGPADEKAIQDAADDLSEVVKSFQELEFDPIKARSARNSLVHDLDRWEGSDRKRLWDLHLYEEAAEKRFSDQGLKSLAAYRDTLAETEKRIFALKTEIAWLRENIDVITGRIEPFIKDRQILEDNDEARFRYVDLSLELEELKSTLIEREAELSNSMQFKAQVSALVRHLFSAPDEEWKEG